MKTTSDERTSFSTMARVSSSDSSNGYSTAHSSQPGPSNTNWERIEQPSPLTSALPQPLTIPYPPTTSNGYPPGTSGHNGVDFYHQSHVPRPESNRQQRGNFDWQTANTTSLRTDMNSTWNTPLRGGGYQQTLTYGSTSHQPSSTQIQHTNYHPTQWITTSDGGYGQTVSTDNPFVYGYTTGYTSNQQWQGQTDTLETDF